jgi:hypothetical protein
MSNITHMSPDVIALELVKIEKNNPCTDNRNEDSASLYEKYYKKVSECVKFE